ncbi:hypothetical protein XENORESO_015753, partial [Xenotaenia resolanae]
FHKMSSRRCRLTSCNLCLYERWIGIAVSGCGLCSIRTEFRPYVRHQFCSENRDLGS